ncbi:MAG: beta-ketoacyl synthase N-terminal-like domain-containing protein [Candidatus Binataceae bacterium]
MTEIAIVGMACRFPGASDIGTFWTNLANGVDSIEPIADERLEQALLQDPEEWHQDGFVKMAAVVEGAEEFDAHFFGLSSREAQIMDPQHRVFLECAWHALEDAGYDGEKYPGRIGVFAGTGMNFYFLHNLWKRPSVISKIGALESVLLNDKDYLSTRVSFKLKLTGPSIVVQSACSTSLVAVHLARESLLAGGCDMALAGGVSLQIPQRKGYTYEPGSIVSPDGRCRAFDAKAEGTIFGSGVGTIVLKRLRDAITDKDHIYAIVKGSAINNDGGSKTGYTAPSIDGQAEVIRMAQDVANVDPETISYVEAHGTATVIGDPVEVAALTKAFGNCNGRRQFCALGSVKTNVGHLDAAAGIAGLIKACLAIEHRQIPASLHYTSPNANITFEQTPFFVNADLRNWCPGNVRRAGVNAFGIGGTNAHVILEEAPDRSPSENTKPQQLLILSAKTPNALNEIGKRLAIHLKGHHELDLGDVAYTLQVGRHEFNYRRSIVCDGIEGATRLLEGDPNSEEESLGLANETPPPSVFMFPGQGTQFSGMARELYSCEPLFRRHADLCLGMIADIAHTNLKEVLFVEPHLFPLADQARSDTRYVQLMLFVCEYALAKLLIDIDIIPDAMIGHSIGEYVAACLAAVFTLEDVIRLVDARGRLMQSTTPGRMLIVGLSEEACDKYLSDGVSLAAVNGPELCVLAGPDRVIAELESRLAREGHRARGLPVSRAFHSWLMDPVLDSFESEVAKIRLQEPKLPFISNVTGTWIEPAQATSVGYWREHLRKTVRFWSGIRKLGEQENRLFMEVGPGQTLITLAKRSLKKANCIAFMPSGRMKGGDYEPFLKAVGATWVMGCPVNWQAKYEEEKRCRVPLPGYPFERQRYWLEYRDSDESSSSELQRESTVARWFYAPAWKQALSPTIFENGKGAVHRDDEEFLFFSGGDSWSADLAERIKNAGSHVTYITPGPRYRKRSSGDFTIDPDNPRDYEQVFRDVARHGKPPSRIVHTLTLGTKGSRLIPNGRRRNALAHARTLFHLAQALTSQNVLDPVDLFIITTGTEEITGSEYLQPENALIVGPSKVLPQEYPNIRCRLLDIETEPSGKRIVTPPERITTELLSDAPLESITAYRGSSRWVPTYNRLYDKHPTYHESHLKKEGAYLIVGGLGKLGSIFGEFLAKNYKARLALTNVSGFPDRREWGALKATDDRRWIVDRLLAMEGFGTNVFTTRMDLGSLSNIREQLDVVEKVIGRLDGVIHAAGVLRPDAFRSLTDTDARLLEEHLRPKVYGLTNLSAVIKTKQLDFCMLVSSLSAVLGGIGYSAYSATNCYMDAFAALHNRTSSFPWLVLDWDEWYFPERAEASRSSHTARRSRIRPPDYEDVIEKSFANYGQTKRIVVSTTNLDRRIKQWIERGERENQSDQGDGFHLHAHARPELETVFVEPRTPTEQKLARIWQKVLGVERIGACDHFFDLGGDSLIASDILGQVRMEFQLELPIAKVLNNGSVEELAVVIDELSDKVIPNGP